MPDAVPSPTLADLVALRALVAEGIEAIRLTREYVDGTGPGDTHGLLPALPGWSWFDWTTKARAHLAESPARPLPEPPPITDDSDYFPNTDFERWHADAAESPARSREEPGLDVAETAMPDGAKLLIGREDGGWWATSTTPRSDDKPWLDIVSTSKDGVLYPSMDEALRALAAILDDLSGDRT